MEIQGTPTAGHRTKVQTALSVVSSGAQLALLGSVLGTLKFLGLTPNQTSHFGSWRRDPENDLHRRSVVKRDLAEKTQEIADWDPKGYAAARIVQGFDSKYAELNARTVGEGMLRQERALRILLNDVVPHTDPFPTGLADRLEAKVALTKVALSLLPVTPEGREKYGHVFSVVDSAIERI